MLCIKAIRVNFIAVLTLSSHHSSYFAAVKFLSLVKISLVKAGLQNKPAFFQMAFSSIS